MTDINKAFESIFAIASEGAEFSLAVASRLDRAEMASRGIKEA